MVPSLHNSCFEAKTDFFNNLLVSEMSLLMWWRKFNNREVVCIIAVIIGSAAASKEISAQEKKNSDPKAELHKKLDTLLAQADRAYIIQDFKTARSLFSEEIKMDWEWLNYESYAFLADCYLRLEQADSGKAIYQPALKRLVYQPKNAHIASEMQQWLEFFPKFPDRLRKENGFVPYNEYPQVLRRASPKYPKAAIQAKVQGRVVVEAIVNEDGRPTNFKIVKSLGMECDEAAIEAFQQILFSPYKRKGRVEKYPIVIPFDFKLSKRP